MLVKERISRYLAYNKSRMLKAVRSNEENAVFFFKIVPFLLHVNSPDLPGFSPDLSCPYGIIKFNPTKTLSRAIFTRYFPNSSALNPGSTQVLPKQAFIHSLKTIGSIGTIAQTEKSDCDYWISVQLTDFPENGLSLLSQKCKSIEEWALSIGHEIHFFLMDLDQTRDNSFESRADDESAGSSLKLLLKDELFRSHILVAGKMPIWWLCPPGLSETEYQNFVVSLQVKEKIDMESFVDLGYISNLPKSEIFGACLWQMNKALDSPFKSVLKFAYLELLMNNQQTLNLFSDRIKQLVTFPEALKPEEQLAFDDIDPYLLLAKELVGFYQREETSKKQGEIIRACLFMKTLEDMTLKKKPRSGALPLTPPPGEQNFAVEGNVSNPRLEAVTAQMKRWNLLPKEINHYLNFQHWSHQDRITAGSTVHQYLGDTYKRLSWYLHSFQNEKQALTITEEDIAILGRKLSSFYSKKPNKIEYIPSLSRKMMFLPDITLHLAVVDGRDTYLASHGDDDIIANPALLIKRDDHLIRLLIWMIANGILTHKTHLDLAKNSLSMNLTDITNLTRTMLDTFPLINFTHISAHDLLQSEVITRAMAVINFAKAPVRGAKNIQSSIISTNSYGEYFLHDYETITQYKNALRVLLTKHEVCRWRNNLTVFIPQQPEQHALQALLDN
ncbi:MAG: class I adenylate cyclase [Desulfobulbaceae bacterium]|nr:class I adenylate cyclase [Desulfobulbaceae bacterium]